jgi:hypothetical protein
MSVIHLPSLELTFVAGDLGIGRPNTQTVYQDRIIKGSITSRYQLLNGLKSSSNQVSLQLERDCESIPDIIKTEGDIKAVLRDGETLLFTGYLSTNYRWTLTESGKQAVEITLEDVGTRLLGKAFISGGQHLFNCSATDAIQAICASAGIAMAEDCTTIHENITATVDGSQSCKDTLDQMLYELGYVYYFNQAGKLCVFSIDCTTTDGIPILDQDDLCVVSGKAITLDKNIRRYHSARVSFTRLGEATNYLIYRNTTGKDDGHPYCYLKLEAGQYFDGIEIFSPQEWDQAQADTLREPALIGACNAASEINVVGSNEIIAISSVVPLVVAQSGSVSSTITAAGGPYIKIEAHNSGSLPYYITRMDAYADILFLKDTTVVKTSDVPLSGESSDTLLQEELKFVHTTQLAQKHANLLGQYHRYCTSQYSFYSERSFPPGSIIRLVDTLFSGLDVNVLIIAKSYSDMSNIISYQAVGISRFDLSAEVRTQTITKGQNDTIGATGPPGADGSSFTITIESSNGSIFRVDDMSTTLSCRVYMNTEEITQNLDASRFCWKRSSGHASEDESWNTSSKAIGHKSIEITPADCSGRTVFFCELDLDNFTA